LSGGFFLGGEDILDMGLLNEFQRRHSALRTINGGICWGLTLRLPGFTQLLLLGYQRILNSSTFKGNLFFLNLPNIGYSAPAQHDSFSDLTPPPID